MTVVEGVFLDTNLLVAASVEAHPSHAIATALLARLSGLEVDACISPQVFREFLAVLTRGPVAGVSFSTHDALRAIQGWLSACDLLEETEDVVGELAAVAERWSVRGKQLHDANIVATMIAHGVGRLATLNASDFHRYERLISLEPTTS